MGRGWLFSDVVPILIHIHNLNTDNLMLFKEDFTSGSKPPKLMLSIQAKPGTDSGVACDYGFAQNSSFIKVYGLRLT